MCKYFNNFISGQQNKLLYSLIRSALEWVYRIIVHVILVCNMRLYLVMGMKCIKYNEGVPWKKALSDL